MYENKVGFLDGALATVKKNQMQDTIGQIQKSGRLILKGGHVVDPKNKIDKQTDILIADGIVCQVADDIAAETGDRVIDCEGLTVLPGLVDMHLHLGDLFEVSTNPIFCAAEDGVTLGLSPGAGNTFMAPSLLGAEVDHGVPINLGVYLGAANVLGTQMSVDELIRMFKGEIDADTLSAKMTRNGITNTTAALTVGIKDHMGHPAALIGNRTANNWWTDKIGHLGVGALANVTVVDMDDKLATYTIVNGEIVSFENRAVRRNCGAGGWISKFGMVRKTGVGELVMFSYQK